MSDCDPMEAHSEQPCSVLERRNTLKWVGGGLMAALACSATASARAGDDGRDNDGCREDHRLREVYGAWHLQVAFLAGPNQGKTEQTLACFAPGGIMVESDGAGLTAHFGSWTCKPERSYVYHLVEFNYDSATQRVAQVVVPHIEFAMDGRDRLHSISTLTTVYQYDVATGALVMTIPIPNVSQVTGMRISTDWVPPSQW